VSGVTWSELDPVAEIDSSSSVLDCPVTLTTVRYLRTKDGRERVQLDLLEFQALVDAASVAEHGLPDVSMLISELRSALKSREGYVEADEVLAECDAAHGSD
jgi:hypothetical protein